MKIKGKVLCIGDVILDSYSHGEVQRISPEAPIPVLKINNNKYEVIGGCGNVAKKYIKDCICYGEDISKKHLNKALGLNLIDEILNKKKYCLMDVIILAVPVDIAYNNIISLLDQVNDNALIIDVGSIKNNICQKVSLHPKRNQFLATHPIAGTEYSGPESAFEKLFYDQNQIICESSKTRPDLLEWALNWFSQMTMKVLEMSPEEHDEHIAYVSHLSHISSFMLGKTVIEKEKDEKAIFDMAGSGFASTVRLAKSSPEMWTPILIENKKNIVSVLTEYIENLKNFKTLLQRDKNIDIIKQLKSINKIEKILNGIKNNNK